MMYDEEGLEPEELEPEVEPLSIKRSELKPCPFCGSEEVGIVYGNEAYGACYNCGAKGASYPREYGYIAESIDRELAVNAWNRRSKIAKGKNERMLYR